MPDSSQDLKPSSDRTLTVVVRRVFPAGLIVGLPDGREGLIRERELAWDPAARRGWRERYRPGDVLSAVYTSQEEGQRPELSFRLAQADPWLDIEERYPESTLIDGVVTGIMPYGVFVELEPGVTGLLHASRFPVGEKRAPGDIFWPGDRVKARIVQVDAEQRRIGLSMKEMTHLRWQLTGQSNPGQSLIASWTNAGAKRAAPYVAQRLPLEMLILHGAKTLLLVDDNERQRKDLADWFQHAGQRVLTAIDGKAAATIAEQSAPHLAIIDINMPELDGIETVQQIQSVSPSTRCVLVTGERNVEHPSSDLIELLQGGVRLFLKPVLPEELLDVLYDVSRPTEPKIKVTKSPSIDRFGLSHIPFEQTDHNWLVIMLERLRAATGAALAVLFHLDLTSRLVSLAAQSGRPPLRAGVLPGLIHSPVRDVAEDGVIVRSRDIGESGEKRFAHLHPLVHFTACVGVPVTIGQKERRALFLFFDGINPQLDMVETQAAVTAGAIEARLERSQLIAQLTGLHRQAMVGQLSDVLTHEINNQRDLIPRTQRLLKDQLRIVQDCAERSPALLVGALDDVENTLSGLTKELDELMNTVGRFGSLTESEHPEGVFINNVILDAVELLRFAARKEKVTIEVKDMTRISYTKTLPVSLRQVLVNTILNAILQLGSMERAAGGRIQILLDGPELGAERGYRISIEDDGPGIHRRLWDQVFELGFTTRPGGKGLGLYISRRLLDLMGGRMYVSQSHILWGSTFTIELPSLL